MDQLLAYSEFDEIPSLIASMRKTRGAVWYDVLVIKFVDPTIGSFIDMIEQSKL